MLCPGHGVKWHSLKCIKSRRVDQKKNLNKVGKLGTQESRVFDEFSKAVYNNQIQSLFFEWNVFKFPVSRFAQGWRRWWHLEQELGVYEEMGEVEALSFGNELSTRCVRSN